MSIADVIPWIGKKKTKVPVKVRKRPARTADGDALRRSGGGDRWLGLAPFGAFGGWCDAFGPRMDVVEHDEAFRVIVDVPGMTEDDIDVTLSGDRLTIRGQKRDEGVRRGGGTQTMFRSQRTFRRSVLIPCRIDADHVEASLKRGVLTVELPKVDGVRNRKRIPIRRT